MSGSNDPVWCREQRWGAQTMLLTCALMEILVMLLRLPGLCHVVVVAFALFSLLVLTVVPVHPRDR